MTNLIQVEEAFLTKMGELGHDVEFIKGFISPAAQQQECWNQVVKEAADGDPTFPQRLAEEIVFNSPMCKQAELNMEGIRGMLQDLGGAFGGNKGIGETAANSRGELGGMIGGGGAGAMIGLVLSKLFGIHPMLGMLLGSALGLGAGGYLGAGKNVSGQSNFLNQAKDLVGAGRENDIAKDALTPKATPPELQAGAASLAGAKNQYEVGLRDMIGTPSAHPGHIDLGLPTSNNFDLPPTAETISQVDAESGNPLPTPAARPNYVEQTKDVTNLASKNPPGPMPPSVPNDLPNLHPEAANTLGNANALPEQANPIGAMGKLPLNALISRPSPNWIGNKPVDINKPGVPLANPADATTVSRASSNWPGLKPVNTNLPGIPPINKAPQFNWPNGMNLPGSR